MKRKTPGRANAHPGDIGMYVIVLGAGTHMSEAYGSNAPLPAGVSGDFSAENAAIAANDSLYSIL